MSDSLQPLQDLPAATKAIAGVSVALLSIATSFGTVAVWYTSMATKDHVEAKIQEHNVAPRTVDPLQSPHPEYAIALKQVDADRLTDEGANEVDERMTKAVFRRLVSLEAADLEPNPRLKAQAAAKARNAFDDHVRNGMAADYAADRVSEGLR